jgi:hypothetical protein
MGEISSIDVPAVSAIGDAVLDVAGRLDRLAAGVDDLTHLADEAVPGSVTCDWAMPAVARSWSYTLGRLAGDLREHGEDIRRSAADYHRADVEAEALLRASERLGGHS